MAMSQVVWRQMRTRLKGKVKSALSQVAHTAGAYPVSIALSVRSISAPPGWDACPLQGYPPALFHQYPCLHLGGEKSYESKVSCLKCI